MILIALVLAMQPLSVRDSFRVGTGDAIMCTAQALTNDRAYADMFDRGYAVTCRDASVAVGQLYALRARGENPAARLAAPAKSKASGRSRCSIAASRRPTSPTGSISGGPAARSMSPKG